MVKEPPILVVNKDRKQTGVRKRTSSTKHAAAKPRKKAPVKKEKKKKGKVSEDMLLWGHYVAMGVAAVLIVISCYYFFIRPYAYRWKPCYGLKAYGVCLPYGYQVHGFDISHHQGIIDWKMLQSTQNTPFPIRFVFMKASEGGDFSDENFSDNFAAAKKNGFIRGAYHFYNPKTSPERQADFFIQSVKLEPGDLPPVLDIETRSRDMEKLCGDLKIWLKRVEEYYKVKPILYTSYKFKTRYLKDSIFDTYPYWIAHYYVDSVRYEGEWRFWQHTDVGTLPGVRRKVDLNVFNGSLEELKMLTIPSPSKKR